MPAHSSPEQSETTPKAPKPADELDSGALDKVTGGLKPTGLKGKGGKTADPCEGGE
jgi:hypothetical protein